MIYVCGWAAWYWALEQPSSSKFFDWPSIEDHIAKNLRAWHLQVWMGSHGHPMLKSCDFELIYPSEHFLALRLPKPEDGKCDSSLGTKKVGKWVSGTKDLQSSQIYPPAFCDMFAKLFLEHVWGDKAGHDV